MAKSRRAARDFKHPDKPGYFDAAVWPAVLKQRELVETLRKDWKIVTLDGTEEVEDTFRRVVEDVEKELKELTDVILENVWANSCTLTRAY